MATLFNTKIKDTYIGLIKTSDNGNVTGSYKNLEDGSGNSIPVQVNTGGMKFTGVLDASTATSILGLNSFGIVNVGGTNLASDSVGDTLSISAGTGISLSANASTDAFVITNTSPNVDQNIFQTVNVNGTNLVATSSTDTLTINAGTGISLSGNAGTDTFVITNTSPNVVQNAFTTVNASGTNLVATTSTDTLTINAGTGISISGNAGTDTFVITNSSPNVDQNIFQTINVNGTNLVPENATDTLLISAGTGISLSANVSTDAFVITNSSPNVDQNIFQTVNVNGTSLVAENTTDVLNINQGQGIQLSANSGTDTFNIILTATTTQVPEGTNLYYTDARVNTYLTGGTIEYIDFNSTAPQIEAAEGQLAFNLDEGCFDAGLLNSYRQHVGMSLPIFVKNQTGVQINAGSVVRAAGTVGTSGRILIDLFSASGDTKYILGITTQDIANGADGYVMDFGKIRPFNTGSFPEGSILYASVTPGQLTTSIPQAPNAKLPIAFVVKTGTTNGEIFVRTTTGADLFEDKRVEATGITNNQILQYKTNRFENVSIIGGTDISIVNNSNNITISYTGTGGGGGGGGGNNFSTFAVPGQSSIVADTTGDTFTFSATNKVTLTTDASSDTLTIGYSGIASNLVGGYLYYDTTLGQIVETGDIGYDPNSSEITFDVTPYFNNTMYANDIIASNISGYHLIKKNAITTTGSYGAGSKIFDLFSGTSLTLGAVYAVNSSLGLTLATASGTTAKDLLVVAVNSSGLNGTLQSGVVKVSTTLTGATNGAKVYLSTTGGGFTTTAPTGSGQVVRILGYVVDKDQSRIFFNPSTDYVVLV